MTAKVPITQEYWEQAYDLAYSAKMNGVIEGNIGLVAVLGICMTFIQLCDMLGVDAVSCFETVFEQSTAGKVSEVMKPVASA